MHTIRTLNLALVVVAYRYRYYATSYRRVSDRPRSHGDTVVAGVTQVKRDATNLVTSMNVSAVRLSVCLSVCVHDHCTSTSNQLISLKPGDDWACKS